MYRQFFLMPLFTALFLVTTGLVPSHAEEFTVHGMGYPPIKAANKAQALLMAKRAAILDGYATALRNHQTVPAGSLAADHFFYDDLSGFIRSAKVVKESYYADGKVEVVLTGRQEADQTTPPSPRINNEKKSIKPVSMKPVQKAAPREVSQQQWLAIIEKMVQFSGQ